MSTTLELTKRLMRQQSVSPDDAQCQEILIERLEGLGFSVEKLPFGAVSNFWATLDSKGRSGGPLLVFAGHTDVVPAGPASHWTYPPFMPTEKDGYLYGRGAADMKGSLAAMITACERYLASTTTHGRIGFLITSDEESDAIDGTRKVMELLQQRGDHIDYCLVGEPSSSEKLGDVVKIGRRGSLSGKLTITGIQGHVAYPQLADNPIHKSLAPLQTLVETQWDQGNQSFQPTSFQISNIQGGTGANNVIPKTLHADFNFRFSTQLNADSIKARVEDVLNAAGVKFDILWHLSGEAFLTEQTNLLSAVKDSIRHVCGIETQASTTGGTSDGRFIAPTGTEVVELGPCNATIHQVDERVTVQELDQLSAVYEELMRRLV